MPGEEEFLLDLVANRVPASVDEAAYVKAAFLSAIAKGEATSPLIDKVGAAKLLGTMQGGYRHRGTRVDNAELSDLYAVELKHTLLIFVFFVTWGKKPKQGNANAKTGGTGKVG